MIDPQATINEIIDQHPAARGVLHARGLDLCCGGSHPLAMAARAHGLELEPLLAELGTACGHAVPTDAGESETAPPLAPGMTVRECLRHYPGTRPLFERYGMQGCGGPEGPEEQIDFFADMHSLPVAELLAELVPLTTLTEVEAREQLGTPAPQPVATDRGFLRKLFGGSS